MSNTTRTFQPARLHRKLRLVALMLALGGAFGPTNALAFTFELSPSEFAQWNEFCQLAYIGTGPGRASVHAPNYSRETIESAWKYAKSYRNGPWHMCAAITWLNRAAALPLGSEKRAWALKQAGSEAAFTFRQSKPGDSFWSMCGVLQSRALLEGGQFGPAEVMLREVIARTPSYAPAYEAYYLVYKRSGRSMSERVAILENGEAATGGASAQLQYFLGLEYLAAGRHDDAQAQAEKAYAKGYPLPGLRRQLAALGRTATK